MSTAYRESAAENRSILVVAFMGKIFGLDPVTGEPKWEHDTQRPTEIEIIIAHGRVYATEGYRLHCLDYETGAKLGEVKIPDQYKGRASMVLERDAIYIGSQGEVSCFGVDGSVRWTQSFPGKGMGRVTLGFPGNVRQADDRGSR